MSRLPLWGLLLIAGCAAPCPTPAANDLASAGSFLRGLAQVPASWTSTDATASGATTPASRARVTLADAAGQPLTGLYQAQTDANGAYGVYKLPASYTFVVQATVQLPDGHSATLETLARPDGDPSREQDLDWATTLVTLATTSGLTGLAGNVDDATFQTAARAVRDRLATQPPPALSPSSPLGFDRAAAEAQIAAMARQDPALAADLQKLKDEAASTASPTQLQADLAKGADQAPLDALSPVY